MKLNDMEFMRLTNGCAVNVACISHVVEGGSGTYSVFIIGKEHSVGLADSKGVEKLKSVFARP